jgi:hypothetical protein
MTTTSTRATRALAVLITVFTFTSVPALAGPSAFVERAAQISFGYSALVNPGLAFGVGIELPLEIPFPIDFSLAADVKYASGISADLTAKALIFPALGGNPPIGLAVAVKLSALQVYNTFGFRFGLGPLVSFDFSPIVVSFSLMPSLGWPGFSIDLGLGVRYYLDPLAIEAALEWQTWGDLRATLGLRYLF